jgi:hypothetical protein
MNLNKTEGVHLFQQSNTRFVLLAGEAGWETRISGRRRPMTESTSPQCAACVSLALNRSLRATRLRRRRRLRRRAYRQQRRACCAWDRDASGGRQAGSTRPSSCDATPQGGRGQNGFEWEDQIERYYRLLRHTFFFQSSGHHQSQRMNG